ncbi:hypothetical protein [Janthinobacterium sp. DSP2-3-3]|uniref:hypothetical protein n=1 Tax=Janthinobacterium sp. DSP2-3-3 TaxID=2804596 RepID=UPI003CF3FFC4
MAQSLLPVTVVRPALAKHPPQPVRVPGGVIALTVGKVQLRIESAADTTLLALVLQRLLP